MIFWLMLISYWCHIISSGPGAVRWCADYIYWWISDCCGMFSRWLLLWTTAVQLMQCIDTGMLCQCASR